MATKKNEEKILRSAQDDTGEEKILREAQDDTKAEEPEKDEWAEEIEMIVPRRPKGDDPQYYVCVNDRRFYIPANGKMQKLPKPIAEVLQQSLEAEAEAEEYADSIPNKTGPSGEI